MNNEKNRVLGRVLAVEEIKAISGGKVTLPTRDMSTYPPDDTGYAYDIIPYDSISDCTSSLRPN
jgi:hypothetical protein